MADTGAGATLALTTTGSIGTIKSIKMNEITIDDLETSDLSSTSWKTFIATDLADPGELTADIYFDGDASVPSLGVSETVTLTLPKVVATNTAATYAGTGYVKSYKLPDFDIGELQMATITVKFDGLTPPAWTAET